MQNSDVCMPLNACQMDPVEGSSYHESALLSLQLEELCGDVSSSPSGRVIHCCGHTLLAVQHALDSIKSAMALDWEEEFQPYPDKADECESEDQPKSRWQKNLSATTRLAVYIISCLACREVSLELDPKQPLNCNFNRLLCKVIND